MPSFFFDSPDFGVMQQFLIDFRCDTTISLATDTTVMLVVLRWIGIDFELYSIWWAPPNGLHHFRQNRYRKHFDWIHTSSFCIQQKIESMCHSQCHSVCRLCFKNQFFHTNSVLYCKALNKFWGLFYNLKV